jgi:hypothetical protein
MAPAATKPNSARARLLQRRREQMLLRLNMVYSDGMEQGGKPLLKGIKAKVRRAVKQR